LLQSGKQRRETCSAANGDELQTVIRFRV
jgi:hypothetical protein